MTAINIDENSKKRRKQPVEVQQKLGEKSVKNHYNGSAEQG